MKADTDDNRGTIEVRTFFFWLKQALIDPRAVFQYSNKEQPYNIVGVVSMFHTMKHVHLGEGNVHIAMFLFFGRFVGWHGVLLKSSEFSLMKKVTLCPET